MAREQFETNRIFLNHFARESIQGCIFTLNYDLLLYWSLLEGGLTRLLRDSFSYNNMYTHDYTTQNDCTTYENSTNLFYLHGALHLRTDLYNDTYKITDEKLPSRLEPDLNNNTFHTIVFEETTEEKMQKILNNKYLTVAYNTLNNVCGSLFTYGFSFSQNDQHIIDAILNSRLENFYVGLYGGEHSGENRNIHGICGGIYEQRMLMRMPISIEYFRSDHVSPW